MNRNKVDLVLWQHDENVGYPAEEWQLGDVHDLAPEVQSAAMALDSIIPQTKADFILFWDERLGPPDQEKVLRLSCEKADIIHAGLRLGTAGLPPGVDYVHALGMLNLDPPPDIRATSWRLSPKATLARVESLRVLGHIDRAFQTLDGAALEMGYRMLQRGAILIHAPELLREEPGVASHASVTGHDAYLFFIRNHKWFWAPYVFARRILSHFRLLSETSAYLSARRAARRVKAPVGPSRKLTRDANEEIAANPKVSVVIPTLNRYPFLRNCFECLSKQTIMPYEVICADQTPEEKRSEAPYKEFPQLPIITIFFDSPGLWKARNAAVKRATGDYILFFDDDITFREDLIEQHLRGLAGYGADVSRGLVDARRGHPLPGDFLCFRHTDNFDTCNTLARATSIRTAGRFDLNFEGADYGDMDFGMRLYLTGSVMLHNPDARVIHHVAPVGGLREYDVHTIRHRRAASRLLNTDVPSRTSIYRFLKYYPETQVREGLILSFLLQSKVRAFYEQESVWLRVLRVPAVFLQIPSILLRMRRNLVAARQLLHSAEARKNMLWQPHKTELESR